MQFKYAIESCSMFVRVMDNISTGSLQFGLVWFVRSFISVFIFNFALNANGQVSSEWVPFVFLATCQIIHILSLLMSPYETLTEHILFSILVFVFLVVVEFFSVFVQSRNTISLVLSLQYATTRSVVGIFWIINFLYFSFNFCLFWVGPTVVGKLDKRP